MKDRWSRYRRGATALLLGVGAMGGVVGAGLASGTAFAADSLASGSIIAAVSAPAIPSTGTNAAGNLTLTIAAGSSITPGDTIQLALSATSGTVVWAANPTVTSNGIAVTGQSGARTNTEVLTVGGFSSGSSNATISISNVQYTTKNATGTLLVVATLYNDTTTVGTFSPATGVSNATLPAPPPSYVLTASKMTIVGAGRTDQPAGNFVLGLYGSSGDGWNAGDTVTIQALVPFTDTNCTGTTSKPEEVGFAATPTATVTPTAPAKGSGYVSPIPTVSVSLGQSSACSGTSNDDEIIVKFTNSGTLVDSNSSYSNPTVSITLSGVEYNVSTATPSGPVGITATASNSANGVVDGDGNPVTNDISPAPTGPSNALVYPVTLTANSPAVVVPLGSTDAGISNIVIAESAPDQFAAGTVTATLSEGTFVGSPTVSASGGGAVVGSVSGAGTPSLSFSVTQPSVTGPATYTLSNLAVSVPSSGPVGPVKVTVTATVNPMIPGLVTTFRETFFPVTAFTVGSTSQVYGQTANGTAAAELESAFPYTERVCPGKGNTANVGSNAQRPVVLATSQFYSDALVASYMAGNLGTGILLTDTNSLSQSALNAMRLEGITTVYVVGGPDAVSSSVVKQLESTPSYTCGGGAVRTTATGSTQDLIVVQTLGGTYGNTLFGTSKDVAESFGSSAVGELAIGGAYGMYNDTTPAGNESTPPPTSAPLPTAIVATGGGFQDAISASGLAYAEHLPILLAPTTTMPSSLQTTGMNDLEAAITDLGIKQVIVVGGPDAVSDTVVSDIENMGVSVLRIAGQDYTATAVELANFEANANINSAGAAEGLGVPTTTTFAAVQYHKISNVAVARGDFYTDALAGSVITGGVVSGTPIPQLLTENPSTVGQYLTAFLNGAGTVGIDSQPSDIVSSLTVFGGPLAVTPSTISTLEADLKG